MSNRNPLQTLYSNEQNDTNHVTFSIPDEKEEEIIPTPPSAPFTDQLHNMLNNIETPRTSVEMTRSPLIRPSISNDSMSTSSNGQPSAEQRSVFSKFFSTVKSKLKNNSNSNKKIRADIELQAQFVNPYAHPLHLRQKSKSEASGEISSISSTSNISEPLSAVDPISLFPSASVTPSTEGTKHASFTDVYGEAKQTFEDLYLERPLHHRHPNIYFRSKIFLWNLITMQKPTFAGRLLNLILLSFIISTLVLFALQSEQSFIETYYDIYWEQSPVDFLYYPVRVAVFFFEYFAVLVFNLEWLGRLYSCTAVGKYNQYGDFMGRIVFIFSFSSICDLVSFVPAYIILLLKIIIYKLYAPYLSIDRTLFEFITEVDAYKRTLILVLVLCRLAGLFKLDRYFRTVTLIRVVLVKKRNEITSVIMLVLISIFIVACLFWIFEGSAQPDKLGSIPRAIYFSVVTMATVGYGDVSPITTIGKILTCGVCIIAVALFATVQGVISSSLLEEIANQKERAKQEKKEREEWSKRVQKLKQMLKEKKHEEEKKRLEAKKLQKKNKAAKVLGEAVNLVRTATVGTKTFNKSITKQWDAQENEEEQEEEIKAFQELGPSQIPKSTSMEFANPRAQKGISIIMPTFPTTTTDPSYVDTNDSSTPTTPSMITPCLRLQCPHCANILEMQCAAPVLAPTVSLPPSLANVL